MSDNLSIQFLKSVSTVLKVLGHPVRLKLIEFLQTGEKSVGEVQHHLDLSQPVTSQHLRHMYSRGILKFRRDGTTYYYSIANEFIHKILNSISECQEKIETGEWKLDLFNSATMEG